VAVAVTRRVLVLNHFASPRGAPGGTRHVDLFGRLDGWDVTILAANRNLLTQRLVVGEGLVRTVWVPPTSSANASRALSWCVYALSAFVTGSRARRPDVVYASSPHLLAGVTGWGLARLHGSRLVVEVRDLWPQVLVDMGALDERSILCRLLRRIERRLYEEADLIAVLAPGVGGALAASGVPPSRLVLLPNGADPADFVPPAGRSELRARLGLSGFVVAYTGAHGVANGLDLLLDAAAELRDERRDVRFVLVGDGPAKATLVARATRENLTNVEFWDPVAKRDMPALLGAVDLGLHVLADVPLFRYGVSPNKLFDYLAAGLPVVTNCGGDVSSLVEESGSGIAVGPRRLAQGIRLAHDAGPAQRRAWGQAGRTYVEQHHSREAVGRLLQASLDELAGPAPTGPAARSGYPGKRLLDLAVVLMMALPAAVVGGVAALAVKLTSRGPVLFRQERVGRHGQPIQVLKLRTMTVDPTASSPFPDERRITPVGRWLRRWSLDELPQLVNVVRGDMSVVGPRPTLSYQVSRYSDRQRQRLAVRPGLTGLAQIDGRNQTTWTQRIEHDLRYVDEQRLGLDVRILVRTAKAVLQGSGVGGHPADDPIAAFDRAGTRGEGDH
jgi:lipopolysaccharide/colanic/teichoic acid biosynthesis glycosyltransferase